MTPDEDKEFVIKVLALAVLLLTIANVIVRIY